MSSKLNVSLWGAILGLLLISSGFNACSGVRFEEAASKSPGNNSANGDVNGSDDTGDPSSCANPNNCKIVGYSDIKVVPNKSNKIDILLVVDNSASMKKENAELSNRLNGMVATLESAGVSWQMCYITTHVVYNSNAGRILDWKSGSGSSVQSIGSRVLKNNTANKDNVFVTTMANIPLGQGYDGSGTEQGIAATRLAINDSVNGECFRNDAALSVIYLSDEDEKSCGGRCKNSSDEPSLQSWGLKYYTDAFAELTSMNSPTGLVSEVASIWPSKAFTAHAIVIKPGDKSCWQKQDNEAVAFYGVELAKLQKATGGILGDICASSYSAQLTNIATRSVATLGSISIRCVPVQEPTVVLSPNPGNVKISRTGNKLYFNPALPAGTEARINYQCYE